MASAANQVAQQGGLPDVTQLNREPEKAWWQKALSPVLEGPIGAGLNVIDTGRRAAVSTVKETIDLMQGEGFSGTDWGNQIASHYGFGDILRDENVDLGKWGNRIVGFIGDVALDPITYMTFGSGALAKQSWRQVADELAGAANGAKTAAERAAFNAARQRVASTGSKMAAGPSALRGIGYEVGLGFSMPGTGMFGRAVGMDKALDIITGGAVSARRAAEWAPAFQAAGAKYGMDAAQSQKLFERAIRLGREDARKLFEEEARLLATKRPGMMHEVGLSEAITGRAQGAAREFIEETADELLGVAQRAGTARTELFWRNGKASLEAPNWERYVAVPGMGQTVGVGRQVARGVEELTDTGLGVVLRTAVSAPGRGMQRVLQSTVAKNLSKRLSRDDLLRTWLQSDNPVKYWAGRMVETGESIGFANAGKYSHMVDSLQAQMLDMAHKGGFDISEVGLGPVQKLVPGMAETEAMAMRRNASRILQDAMDEPWEYLDEAGNAIPNGVSRHLDEFQDWVRVHGDGTVTAQQLHEELRRFWDDISTGWEDIAKRSLRQELKPNEVYVTRRVSAEARKVYKDPKYTRAHEAGERLADEGAQAGKGKPKRDQSYATKERVFAPGQKFIWDRTGGPKRASFDIVEPGRPLQVGARQLAHAPSVRKQIEMFIREVDPDWAAKNTFFETDTAKLIDGYKSAQGRELIWAGMEDHLAAQGIFVEAANLDEVKAFFNSLTKAAKKGRTAQKNMGKAAGKKAASAQNAAARARGAMDTADVAAANRASAQADMWGLDPQIRKIQASMMDLIDDVNAATVRSSRTGRFRTAPEARTAMEDLVDMAVGLEVTGRMAKALRSISETLGGVDDLGRNMRAVEEAYSHIVQQLAIARDTLEVAKNAAARLGGQDQTIRDLESLISGLEKGFVSEGTPDVIRQYVDDVHEVGRLAAELEAPITFNSGYRIPVSQADIANRPWAVTARNRLLRENEAEVQRLVREQKGTREQPGPARRLVKGEQDALDEIADTFERGAERIPLLEVEARRRTLLWVQEEFDKQTVDWSNRAQRHMGLYVDDPYKNSYNRFAAEALDLRAQRNAMEANFHRMPDELDEIFETDMAAFQNADNMFGRLLDPTGGRPRRMTPGGEFETAFETNIGALKAGLDDGALPFGPAYMTGTLGAELNEELGTLLRSRMNAGRGDISELMQAWDSVTGYFKAQAVARPAFIQRNGLGGLFNNILAGMDPKNAARFMRLRGRAIEAGWKDALKEVGLTPEQVRNVKGSRQFMQTRPSNLKRRAAELGAEKLAKEGVGEMRDLRRVYRSGAIGAGQAASEVAQSFRLHGATTIDRYGRPIRWNPLRRDSVWNTAIRNGNGEMEEFLRGSLALDSISSGLNEAEAIFRVNQFHFNYSKEGMTDWERNLGARAYPFYTWTRNSLPLMATQLLYNPKPFLRYLQLKNNIELGVEKDRTTPGWYGKRWGIDLSGLMGNPNQGARTWAFPDLPFMDLIEFAEMPLQDMERPFGGLTRLAEGVAPQIKFPVETLMGAQIFRNIPISTEYVKPPPLFDVPGLLPFLEKVPGDLVAKNSRGQYGIRENALYGLGTFVPLVSQMRRLIPREERYKDEDKLFSAWLSWVMPIGIRRQGPRDTRGARFQRDRDRSMSRSERRSLERIR